MTWPFGDLRMFGYDVVMIDPPWPWGAYSAKGLAKSPEAQYRTMTLPEIAALPVGDLCSDGGLIFMWCTWPLIHEQAPMLRRWGFTPVTGGAWGKRTESGKFRWGTGYVLRSVCEPFLVGSLGGLTARGSRLINMIETVENAVIDGLAREHSRKPDEAYSLLEALVPDARRADVFARQRRPGWDAFGDQLDKFDEVAAP